MKLSSSLLVGSALFGSLLFCSPAAARGLVSTSGADLRMTSGSKMSQRLSAVPVKRAREALVVLPTAGIVTNQRLSRNVDRVFRPSGRSSGESTPLNRFVRQAKPAPAPARRMFKYSGLKAESIPSSEYLVGDARKIGRR